jgi:hypothetical protein
LNGYIFTLSFSLKKEIGSKNHTAHVVLPGQTRKSGKKQKQKQKQDGDRFLYVGIVDRKTKMRVREILVTVVTCN